MKSFQIGQITLQLIYNQLWAPMFYVYKITNNINKKVYIGKTNDFRVRWQSHITRSVDPNDAKYWYPISCALRKYGNNNFTFEILDICSAEIDANELEIKYIVRYRSNINVHGKSFGYNLTDGGDGMSGFRMSDETRNKMSKSHIGLRPTPDSLEKRGKLTWTIVDLIRNDYASGSFTQRELAGKYKVSVSKINSVLNYNSWRK